MAEGPSPASAATRRGSAVSRELFMMSVACSSGESSAPTAAWMPPCAFDELLACSEPLLASTTRAPETVAETAALRPAAPLPITRTS
jgi:hypothetical protein